MSGRVEGTPQSAPQLESMEEAKSQTQTQAATPSAPVNRVEQAKIEEREFAQNNPLSSGKVRDYLEGIPTPGAAEFELHGYLDHNGGHLKAEIERNAAGEYEVKLKGGLQAGLHLGPGGFIGGNGATTFKFRTAEAASDFLSSVAASSVPLVGLASAGRVEHYVETSMYDLSASNTAGATLSLPMPCLKAGVELKGELSATIDLDRGSLILEQAVSGEAVARMGGVIFGGGLEGEVTGKLRTEYRLPREQLEQLRAGKLSPGKLRDFVAEAVDSKSKLVLEGGGRGEFTTPFAVGQSKSVLLKAEAEVDLSKMGQMSLNDLTSLEKAKGFVHGHMKRYDALEVAGTELQMMVLDAKLQATRYQVTELPLGHGQDEAAKLQQEFDGKRLTNNAVQ